MASCPYARAFVAAAALSSLGCRFELTGLRPGAGGAPDLAGGPATASEMAAGGATDLAMSRAGDLATVAPADLAMSVADLATAAPADLAPMCNPPNIGSTVGPGPNLAITLSRVKINNGSNFAHVAPGATFSVRADYSITDDPGGNIDQILVGIGVPSTPLDCLFDATVSGTSNGTNTLTLTAPTTPGTYTLRFHYGQDVSCKLSWWTVNGAPNANADFAAFCVP